MATTIRVGEDLRDRLEALKQEKNLSSFNDLLEQMLDNEAERTSMFGEDRELEEWSEKDRIDLTDEK